MRVTTLARRLGSVAVVAALTLGFAGCGSDDKPSDPGSSASGTDAITTDPDTESDSDSGSVEPAEVGLEELAPAEFYSEVFGALQDAGTFAMETTTTSGDTTTTMTGEARYDADSIAMKVSSSGAQAMEMIMLDQVLYLKSADLGAGDKWIKIDLNDPDSMMSMFGKATDPEVMFKAMSKPKKLELIGEEEVDGAATNHYRITMDPQQYMAAMEFPAEMAQFMPKQIVSDMWVDADNLPRKYSQTMQTPAVGGGKPSTSTTEGFYRDFGRDVDIEAPPASEISDQAIPGIN